MNRGLKLLSAAGLILVAACQDGTTSSVTEAPSLAPGAVEAIPGRYIVVFKRDVQDVPALARQLTQEQGGTLRYTYLHALKGMAVALPEGAAERLARNPNVAYIEADARAQLHDTQNNPPSWGTDRVDQRDLPLSNSYTYTTTASNVNVYVLDTGIRLTHTDFGGRASYIPNGANGDFVNDGHGSAADCHGHGTHVAGTAAGATYGLAKGAQIWSGRVVNCAGSGDVSMAIAGVDWITANGVRPAVVNMSLGYGDVQSLRDAVEASVAAGVNYAVSAGNGNFLGIPQNACNQSPGGAPNANTVGASDINDNEASFSNYGTCVDIIGPGVAILSAGHNSDNGTATMSGTSMSSPHVAGAIALYLADNPTATPAQVSSALISNASLDKISLHASSSANNTPNRLLFTAEGDSSGPDPDPDPDPEPGEEEPVAAFSVECTRLACDFTDASTDDVGVTKWRWDFGDGGSSTAQSPSHTYRFPGTFRVTLTVTDGDGQRDRATTDVTVRRR